MFTFTKEKLTTYHKIKAIREALLRVTGESLTYNVWSDEYRLTNIKDIFKHIKNWETKSDNSFKIDPSDLSLEEMIEFRFYNYLEEKNIMLIPIWLFPFLSDEFECESILGTKHFKLSELENKSKYGCLIYGVIPK